MIKLLKPLALGCALATAVAFSGCADTSWIEKVDGITITPGVYMAFLMSARNNVLENAEYSSSSGTASNPWSQTIESSPAVTWAQNTALKYCGEYAVIEKLGQELSVSLTSSEQTQAANLASSYNAAEAAYALNGVSVDSLKRIIGDSNTLVSKVFTAYYGPKGKEAVTDTELMTKCYDKNFVRVKHIVFKTTDDSGNALSDAKKKAVKATADSVLHMAQADKGASFDSLMTKYSEDKTSGKVNNPTGYIFSEQSNSSTYDSTFISTGVSLKIGEIKEVETSYGYDVIYKIPLNADVSSYNSYFTTNRTEILQEYKSSAFQTLIEGRLAKAKIEKNNAAIAKYTPQNIKDASQTSVSSTAAVSTAS